MPRKRHRIAPFRERTPRDAGHMAAKDELGRAGEERAAQHLRGNGYTVLARNWRCAQGEIDIVAARDGHLAVVEVKTRRTTAYGHPFEAIDARKRRRAVATRAGMGRGQSGSRPRSTCATRSHRHHRTGSVLRRARASRGHRMTTARTWAVALTGVDGHLVEVEADMSNQTPEFRIIGLPDKSLGEAVQRVHNACKNAGLDLPRRRLTVNLSPASLPKHGAGFDLGIAMACLAAGGSIEARSIAATVHIGELGLDGRVRPVPGVLPAVFAAARAGFETVIVPRGNEAEARLVPGVEIRAAASLAEVAVWHGAMSRRPMWRPSRSHRPCTVGATASTWPMSWVRTTLWTHSWSQQPVVITCFLAAPRERGKTMLARRLPGILPALEEQEALEVASVRSLSGEAVVALDPLPPLEAPHHSASVAALVGGGSRTARPGAIARAHRGVLFLDEAAEFSRVALDALRQPLESGVIEVHRAGFTATFPARFQLLLAMNPCPCGNHGVRGAECVCPPMSIRRYSTRLSGPLRDRIDIDLQVNRVAASRAMAGKRGDLSTAQARDRVAAARARAASRWNGTRWRRNGDVPGTWLRQGPHRLPAVTRSPSIARWSAGLSRSVATTGFCASPGRWRIWRRSSGRASTRSDAHCTFDGGCRDDRPAAGRVRDQRSRASHPSGGEPGGVHRARRVDGDR